jgi:hypothetical protein
MVYINKFIGNAPHGEAVACKAIVPVRLRALPLNGIECMKYIIANYYEYKDYLGRNKLSPRDAVWVNHPYQLRGLEDIEIIAIGSWWNIPDIDNIIEAAVSVRNTFHSIYLEKNKLEKEINNILGEFI